jgi:hypothetical protein
MKKIYFTGVLVALLISSLTTFAQSQAAQTAQSAQSREDILKEIETKHKELAALEKIFLEPAEEDRLRHADFLRMPNTGLIRLLPREKYDGKLVRSARAATATGTFSRTNFADLPQGQQVTEDTSVRSKVEDTPREVETQVSNRGLTINGGGAYYSFTRRAHEYGKGSDIELQRGELSTGFAGANYGFLVNLGDVPLENISLGLPEVNALATYKPASEEPKARVEQRRFSNGTEVNGMQVKDTLPVRADSTYLLRAIYYSRSDVLVAFRVVRVDSDGSAIILWKLLKKYSIPQLERN